MFLPECMHAHNHVCLTHYSSCYVFIHMEGKTVALRGVSRGKVKLSIHPFDPSFRKGGGFEPGATTAVASAMLLMTTAISSVVKSPEACTVETAGLEVTGGYTRTLVRDARINAQEIGLCRDLQHCLSTNSCISLPSSKLRLSYSESGTPIGFPLCLPCSWNFLLLPLLPSLFFSLQFREHSTWANY